MNTDRILSVLAWAAALALAAFALFLGWRVKAGDPVTLPQFDRTARASAPQQAADLSTPADSPGASQSTAALPGLALSQAENAVMRHPALHTIIPDRPLQQVKTYTVDTGDSVFEIAARYGIKPETILWANYDQLNDNPDLISNGMQLWIPPVDGVLHRWKSGDTLEGVAAQYEANLDDILSFTGNQIDLVDRQVAPDALVMVPGGHREFRQWLIPTIPRGQAGVSRAIYGEGACEGGYDGAFGTGGFVWPAGNHSLSGNDYWSGHLGIDIAAGEGAPIYAADSGVVVFSGWSTGGYGNTIVIDHGNGYQTLYGHLSSTAARCGQSVSQGATIGYSGSTGNSTGAHLHFEVRYQGGFVSPWYVLPAP
jgi:murein DD-endopeptidase MepM/ murein hydrolase activator NlpD